MVPMIVVLFLLSGTYTIVSVGCGFIASLIFNLYPLRGLCELIIDPESVVGIQIGFLLGQVGFTTFVKIFYQDSNIWGSVLRGIIIGRIIMVYYIQDEIKNKKALGKAHLV